MENNKKAQLVIIPGWGGTKESWQKFIDLAQIEFEIYFISLPGFGEVPAPETVWGVMEYSAYIKQEINKLNLVKPILLGHSFGGQLAVNLAGNNPSYFSKLILSGAAVMRPRFVVKRMFGFVVAKAGRLVFALPGLNKVEKIARKILYRTTNAPDYDRTGGTMREIFKKVIRESQVELLAKIKTPTLVVWGDKDSYVTLSEGKLIVKKIAGAELAVIKGGKHGLHLQQPENLLKIIIKFIKK
jgi:pimeloyl-ACP methyl ester carboxylesterase